MTTQPILTAPRVRPLLQVGAGDADVEVGQALYDSAHYNAYPEATYSGVDAQWTDVSCDAIEAVLYYGRERAVEAFDIGTATLRIQNPEGVWDYPPSEDLTVLTVRPGRMIRVGVTIDEGSPIWLWTGWIDATEPVYDPMAAMDIVTVSAVCAKGQVARAEVPRLMAEVGAGETVTARMTRYTNLAKFPAHRRHFDESGIQLIGTTLGGRLGSLMDDSAESAAGDIYGDLYGNLVYRNSDWQTNADLDVEIPSIGNRGLPGEVCPSLWETPFRRADFTNAVNYGRSGEDPYLLEDLGAQTSFGVETYTTTSLEPVDNQVLHRVGQRIMRVRNFSRAPWISRCHLDAARDGAIGILRYASPFIPSIYQCGHLAPDGRQVFARETMLTGIEHTINATAWTAVLSMDDAAPFLTNSDARYDSAQYNDDRYARVV